MTIEPYYDHGGIQIYHGDCRDVLPGLGKVDLVLTDPPYGIGEARGKNKSRGKPAFGGSKMVQSVDYGQSSWDDKPPDNETINLVVSAGKNAILFGGNYFWLPPSSCWLVWDKDNGDCDFADCELAWTNLKMAVRLKKYRWNGMLQEPGRPREKRYHPTQKPLEIMTWCIAQADKKKRFGVKTILDPFAGSCTTAVAAKQLGRKCICIEREEKYCQIGVDRLSQEVLDFG
jgi:DNA modification methylase